MKFKLEESIYSNNHSLDIHNRKTHYVKDKYIDRQFGFTWDSYVFSCNKTRTMYRLFYNEIWKKLRLETPIKDIKITPDLLKDMVDVIGKVQLCEDCLSNHMVALELRRMGYV